MFLTRLKIEDTPTPDIWRVTSPLVWDSGRDDRLVVPAGFETDLASIPRLLRNLPFLDPNGVSRRPAVLHDWLYNFGDDRSKADLLLRDALLVEGAGRTAARAFYWGVRLGGRSSWRNDHANHT